MLGIYQEYVRNHHYSLQVLAEYKQNPVFNQLLRRYEEKSICEGRSLATFLTYPMHQVCVPQECWTRSLVNNNNLPYVMLQSRDVTITACTVYKLL